MVELRQTLDEVVKKYERKYVGLAAAAVHGDRTVMTGRGATARPGAPPDPHTVFQIGSITKVFTSLLLADLVLAGRVALDQPVADFFPEISIPSHGRPISLLDLATHTSGLPRVPRRVIRRSLRHLDNPYAHVTADDLETALRDVHLRREPGTKVHYSNFGAAALGQALGRALGKPYDALVVDRICEPLGMSETMVNLPPALETRRAQGHSRHGKPVPDWEMPALPGMGALHSTTTDMTTLLRAQLDPASTPLAETIRMTHVERAGKGRLVACLGWFRSPIGDRDLSMVWHNGGTGGTFSFAGFVPEWQSAVVVFANSGRPVDGVGVDLLRAIGNL